MKTKEKETNFQQSKIKTLNKFFMNNFGIGSVIIIFIYIISFIFLIILLNFSKIDEGIKISLISMIATFILTTSKSIIEKFITIIQFLMSILSAEQRGLNKNIGIEVDRIEFENMDTKNETEN